MVISKTPQLEKDFFLRSWFLRRSSSSYDDADPHAENVRPAVRQERKSAISTMFDLSSTMGCCVVNFLFPPLTRSMATPAVYVICNIHVFCFACDTQIASVQVTPETVSFSTDASITGDMQPLTTIICYVVGSVGWFILDVI
jgi:hypothetical protein